MGTGICINRGTAGKQLTAVLAYRKSGLLLDSSRVGNHVAIRQKGAIRHG